MSEPIAWGYDFAWADISGAEVKSNGGTFAIRYLCGSARLTPQERDELLGAGVKILLVAEEDAAAFEGGFPRGVQMAQQANAEADALGYPAHCPIFYADDSNDGDASQEIDFMRGVRSVGGRPPGTYSGGNVLAAVEAIWPDTWLWLVETWYPNQMPHPHIVQLANTREPAMVGVPEGSYDTNLLYRPIPMWGEAAPAPSESPIYEENAMLYVATSDGSSRVKKNDVILTDNLSVLKVDSVNNVKNVGVAFLPGNDIEAVWADKDRSRSYT